MGNITRRLIELIGLYATLITFSLFAVLPLLWMITTSFKPTTQIFISPPVLVPERFNFIIDHYLTVLKDSKMLRYFLNSVIISSLSVIAGVIVGVSAGYGFARFRFKGRNWLFIFVIISRMIPRIALIIPLYMLMIRIRLVDTHSGLIIVYAIISLPMSVWLLTAYFMNLPVELEEAALLDGCTRWQALTKIVLPISLPAVFAVGMYCFLLAWNEYLLALVFSTSYGVRPIAVGLTDYFLEALVDWGPLMAACVLATIPPMVVFWFGQKHFISGLVRGAMKG
ncbi:Diacetylchitobiose uptake system permease protein DasC [subsurface metagenome]